MYSPSQNVWSRKPLMNNSESSQTMCMVGMMVRRLWGWSSWSAVLHRGCFIKLVSGINEPQQKPPWHDIHETHWEAYQHARCISVGVLIVSDSEMSVFYFVMHNKKSQRTWRLSNADRALWAKKKPMTKGLCSGQMHYSVVISAAGIFK